MKILSLDLSTKSSGWAIFDDGQLLNYGCQTSSSTDLVKRIHIMVTKVQELVTEYDIDKIIIEEVRPDTSNPKTLKALMWLQGALAIMMHDNFPTTEIEYIYPSSWRAAIGIRSGRGIKRESLKQADIDFIKKKYDINVNDDIADAICIGLAQFYEKDNNEINWE